jgi:hypothetical protein
MRTGLLAGAAAGAAGTAAGGLATGLAAMAATDLSMARLGVSDPRRWTAGDWLSDLVPHLVYGSVTYATLAVLARGRATRPPS